MDKTEKYKVQSVNRTFDILDCFSFQKRELSLTEICQITALNKTTTKRLLSNLVSRGYLTQDRDSKRYQLGLRLFELGGVVFSSFSLRKAAAYPMSSLQHTTGLTILLGGMMDDQLVYLDKREGLGLIQVSSDIGWRRSLSYGMLGMILMAYLPPEKIKEILKKFPLQANTPNSIIDQDAFSLRLEKIRKDGYVVESEEAVEGIVGIAAPIRDYSRRVIAALGVTLPKAQIKSEESIESIVDLVKEKCDEISSNMGYLKM
jgi:IclR family KDG regulon transcriptional repressor